MEPLVHADAFEVRETCAGLFDDRYRDPIVGDLLHHLVVEDEAVLILDHGHAQPQLDRDPGLALADPLGVRLENGEDLLSMGDALSAEHARRIWSIWRSAWAM